MKEELDKERYKLLNSVQRLLEGPMIFLGFVWLVLLIIELIWGIPEYLVYISNVIWIIFIVDFCLKLFLAPKKLNFIKKNWLTAISLIIPAIRVFRLFRFIRLLRGLRGIRFIRVISSLNRSMSSLGKTMERRGFGYAILLTVFVIFGGAAGMFAIERGNPGFENYGMALWWTAMRVITAGSEAYPLTTEGRTLTFVLAVYGYAIFGYVTATLASFFIGRDAEESDAPVAGAKEITAMRQELKVLTNLVIELKAQQANKNEQL